MARLCVVMVELAVEGVAKKVGRYGVEDACARRRRLLALPCDVSGYQVEISVVGVEVWCLRVSDVPARLLEEPARCGVLSAVELASWGRLRFKRDRHAYVMKRLLVRGVLSLHAAEVRPGEWEFGENEFGRPEIAGSELSFNLSRSGEMAVCAVATRGRVGVDVEDMQRDDLSEVAGGILGEGEILQYAAMEEDERREALYRFWTLKEAYLKARGTGLTVPMEEVQFDLRRDGVRVMDVEDVGSWRFAQVRLMGSYMVAVAWGEAQESSSSRFGDDMLTANAGSPGE